MKPESPSYVLTYFEFLNEPYIHINIKFVTLLTGFTFSILTPLTDPPAIHLSTTNQKKMKAAIGVALSNMAKCYIKRKYWDMFLNTFRQIVIFIWLNILPFRLWHSYGCHTWYSTHPKVSQRLAANNIILRSIIKNAFNETWANEWIFLGAIESLGSNTRIHKAPLTKTHCTCIFKGN